MKIICIEDEGFFVRPDTVLLRNNEPFYVPGFASGVGWRRGRVVRVDRVAKCVQERFAHRYYSQAGAAVEFTARGVDGGNVVKIFDHSLAVGRRFLSCVGDAEVDSHITNITRFVTLKIGDLIFIPAPGECGDAVPGDRLTANLDGETLLDFEIR